MVADGSGAMFDRIAGRYDLLNRLTSLGLDHSWRRALIEAVGPAALPAGSRVLDVATGTADVALALLRAAPGLQVVGLDPSPKMLQQGARKWQGMGQATERERLVLRVGQAEQVPYPDGHFAAASMAFGIRNVKDRARALRELKRVVAPGGTVAILELTEPQGGLLGFGARLWVHRVVPAIGAALSGRAAYRYLARSIGAFPAAEAFAAQLSQAGLSEVGRQRLAFGAAHLFVGRVPQADSPGALHD